MPSIKTLRFALIVLSLLTLSTVHCGGDRINPDPQEDIGYSDGTRDNTPPTAELISPVATDLFAAASPISLRVEVSDAEQAMSELTVSCYLEGQDDPVSEGIPDDQGMYADTFTAPETGGEYTLNCAVTDGAEGQTDVSGTFQVNTSPTAPVVAITPEKPTTTDALTVAISEPATDPNRAADALTQTIKWLKDGTVTEYTGTEVPAEATTRGEVWSVEVFASDDLTDGALGAAEVTIQNAQPTAPEVAITPTELTVADTATCGITKPSEDADGDDIVLTYFWSLNGEALEGPHDATLVLSGVTLADGSLPKAGDSLTCGVSASDNLVSTLATTSAEVVLTAADICGTDANPCGADATCTNNDTAVPDCACNPGFDGDGLSCTEIDECADAPCNNGGTCTDEVNGFTCECAPGYEGDTCETDTDECADYPCQNGGTCTDAVNSFSCECAPGYEGDTCETNIDECAENPCQNGGTCTDGVNAFTCECAPGYEGDTCETDIDECAPAPCQNGGTCTQGIASFTCACAPGYEGDTCETDIDDCASNPCLNGGTCTDQVNAFSCECVAGYEGTTCETNIDECASAPCQNGGTCVDGVNAFTCECAPGYEGTTCETDIDECAPAPCQNGGTCTQGIASFTCACAPGYEGDTCETDIDDCASSPCLNGGACIDQVNAFSCECVPGYEGTTCETNIDECASAPCQNGGSCVDGVNAFTCECAPGYEGNTCETDIDECATAPCQNGGTCTDAVNGYTCECTPGFGGDSCEIKSEVHYLVVGGGGRGGASWSSSNNGGGGAGGLMTSWGDKNGGGEPVGSPLQLVSGVTYSITVGSSGQDSSITGGGISLVATKGNSGGGAENGYVGGDGGHAGKFGYSGIGNDGQTGGGGGGAGGSAYSKAGGPPLISNITGTDTEYAEGGWGEGQGFGEYGAPTGKGPGGGGSGNDYYDNKLKIYVGVDGRDGIVILRVPTPLAGSASGATSTTVGSDTVFTWKGNGSYTAK